MKVKLPEIIRCTVSRNNRPLQGVLIKATLKTEQKNDYSFVFGPTSNEGVAELSGDQIRLEALQELNLAIMDFEPLEDVFSGTVVLQIMTTENITRALKAFDLYKAGAAFPEGYAKMLKNAIPATPQGDVLLNVCVEPSQIEAVVK